MKTVKGRSKNGVTGIVHGLTGKKIGHLKLYETVCGKPSGLFWLKANFQKITCTKCLSELPRDINDGLQ